MGNRALIIPSVPTREKPVVGVYVHWNGGLESVLAFCEVCKQRKFREPSHDDAYAMARLCGVIHEFFGINDSLSLGIRVITYEEWKDRKYAEDNGFYVLGKNWEIVKHEGGYCGEGRTINDLNEKQKQMYNGIVEYLLKAEWKSTAE